MTRRLARRARAQDGSRGGEVPRWHRAVAVLGAMAIVVGAASCSDDNASDPSPGASDEAEGTASSDGTSPIEPRGDRLAVVEGIGTVHAGTATNADALTITAAEIPAIEDVADGRALADAGMLDAGKGLDVEVDGELAGYLEVRLALPEPPSDTAIPAVVHVDDTGAVHVEAALWDTATNEAVITVDTFSPRWAAWWQPDRWLSTVWQGIAEVGDSAADYVTGRTDPPPCGTPPVWAGEPRLTELSSVHVCVQSNDADNGTERVELLLRSNRNTGQLIAVPAGHDYLWVDGVPDALRPVLTDVVGGNPGDVLLLGGHEMSWGHRRPVVDTEVEALSYQTPWLGVLNQVFGLFGVVSGDDALAVAVSAYSCLTDVSGIDVASLDLVPEDDVVWPVIRCVVEEIADPDGVVAAADEILIDGDLSAQARNKILATLRRPLDRLQGLATRLAVVLTIGQAATHTWDAVFDNLADGTLVLPLAGGGSPNGTAANLSPAALHGPATMVVVDTSGSMGDTDDLGAVKIEAAKQALLGYLGDIAPDTTIGLRTYPAGGSGCDAGRPAFPLAPRDPAEMSAFVRGLSANGDTPTAESLLAAADDLRAAGVTEATLILLSDGEHTCEDPCAAAEEIRDGGIDVRVIPVGFMLSEAGADELRCIANATGGVYIDAADTEDLATVISDLSAPRLELTLDHPDSVVADVGTAGWVEISATATNASDIEARAVSALLRVDEGASPGLVAPDRPLGNLAPRASATTTFRFRPALSAAGSTFRFTVIASAPDSADVEGSGAVLIADGTTRASAGPLLADADRVAILGDSFSSGEGTSDYIDGTDQPREPGPNLCHRSRHTYLVEALDIPDELIVACSGATAKEHILGRNWGNNEPPQVETLREQQVAAGPVDAVVLTLGGNDAGFGTLGRACAVPANWSWDAALDLQPPDITPPCDQSVGGTPASRWVDEHVSIGNLSDPLVEAYMAISHTINEPRWIETRGSLAPIVVLAYPRVLPYGRTSCFQVPTLTGTEMAFINDFTARLNGEIEGAVKRAQERGYPVEFVPETEGVMQPDHTLCDGDQAYVRPPGDLAIGTSGRELLHPNINGYQAMTRGILSWSNTQAADRWSNPQPDAPLQIPDGQTISQAVGGADQAAQLLQPAGDPASLSSGALVELQVDGFAPDGPVELRVESDPLILGDAYADGDGVVDATVRLPDTLASGRHDVIATGWSPDAEVRSVHLPVDVTRPRSRGWLAPLAVVLSALAMLAAGGALLVRTRRQPTASVG